MATFKFIKLFYKAGRQTLNDDGVEHAGYLAFLALLSFFPGLIFLLSFMASVGKKEFGVKLLNEFYRLLPQDVVSALSPTINDILSGPPAGLLTIAIAGILWTSSSGVEGVRNILNRVYRVSNPPHFLLRRLASILQFIVVVIVLVVTMFLIAILPGVISLLKQYVHVDIDLTGMFTVIKTAGSSVVMVLAVASGYYILPNIKHSFKNVIPGAALCVMLWLLVLKLFTTIITHYTQISVLYGGLAGIIITLLFFYIMALIYIYGAEFNYLLEKEMGVKMVPKEVNPKKPELDKKIEELLGVDK